MIDSSLMRGMAETQDYRPWDFLMLMVDSALFRGR